VLRNGIPAPSSKDVFSLLVVPLAAGLNRYVVTVQPSALRLTCWAMSALVILACVIGLAAARLSNRQHKA